MIGGNSDLPGRLDALVAGKGLEWVMEEQPAGWRPAIWKAHWRKHSLPCPHVLDDLESEIGDHGRIRRMFVFDAYRDRPALELLIVVMAWGLGLSNYGPARAGKILSQPNAGKAIEAVVDATRQDGAAAGYSTYYSKGNTLKGLDVAFVTKLLHFAGYESPNLPRPLIYDKRVADAMARLPAAPLLPTAGDEVTTVAYDQYCRWVQNFAIEHGTEPVVVEWALFALGGEIRDTLRAGRSRQHAKGARKRTR